MPRYIDADILKNALYMTAKKLSFGHPKQEKGIHIALKIVDEQPTSVLQEVKHGRWSYESRMFLDTITDDGHIHRRIYDKPVYNQVRICSICGVIISNANEMLMFYCPHCGAKMDGE